MPASDPQLPPVMAWVVGGGVLLLQICYPLVHGGPRGVLTALTVGCFAAASLLHAWGERGLRASVLLLAVAGGTGLAVEIVGVHTGFPFGSYTYSGRLGPKLASVPLIIPLAWTMMSWPALLAARRLVSGPVRTALVGGVALAGWDLFLDPQMVDAGNWAWHAHGPALQGIPLTNTLGWLGTGVVLMAALDRLLPRHLPGHDALPLGLYLWTWGSSVLGNLLFFGHPLVALTGGLAMGASAVPLAAVLRGSSQRTGRTPVAAG